MHSARVIDQTKIWVQSFVIDLSLCPFAKRVVDAGEVRYRLVAAGSAEASLEAVLVECQRLDREPGIETTLLIYPQTFAEFNAFLLLVEWAENLLVEHGYEGVYQVASFHPGYQFAGAAAGDPANYTNRSPYPMLHLLRERSVESALQSYPDSSRIPERNMQRARGMGSVELQVMLDACYAATPRA